MITNRSSTFYTSICGIYVRCLLIELSSRVAPLLTALPSISIGLALLYSDIILLFRAGMIGTILEQGCHLRRHIAGDGKRYVAIGEHDGRVSE